MRLPGWVRRSSGWVRRSSGWPDSNRRPPRPKIVMSTPYQVRHTHASWLIDKGVDLERVRNRLGHGDLTTTTRYVKILDEEDSTAADAIATILGDAA